VDEDAPLCLLLLDGTLEAVAFGPRAEDLNRAPGVVVVEPGRKPPPALLAPRVAKRLARRLPGVPRVIVLVGSAQRQLALALLGAHPGSELWVAGEDFDQAHPEGVAAFQANAGLWERLEALGIARR
jgi:hypothetical protein